MDTSDVSVAEFTERLKRRLRALTHGRNLHTNVTQTREAPDSFRVDVVLLDRVLDNILTNAAKHTERGSVAVEVGGTPGFVTIKVSDSGKGMTDERIQAVLSPRSAGIPSSTGWGVGLSVVVDLLRRAGGRLEAVSKPGTGTTIWAHFPLAPPRPSSNDTALATDEKRRSNVVSIRRTGTKRST